MDSFLKNFSNNNLSDYKNPDLIRAFDDYFRDDFIHKAGGLISDPNTNYNLYILYSIFGRLPMNSGIRETEFKDFCLKKKVYEKFCKTVLLKNGWKEDYEIPLFFHYQKKILSSGIKSFIFITNEFIYALSEDKSAISKTSSEIFFKNLRVGKSWFGIGNNMDYSNEERTFASIPTTGSLYQNNTPEFLENISKHYHSYISFQGDSSWTKVD
jgi:hypothetical protein